MFRIDQILTATQFLRSFREVAEFLAKHQEPLLITQRNGRFLVIMDGEFFDGVMRASESVRRGAVGIQEAALSGSKA